MDDLSFPSRMAPIDAMFWQLEEDRRLRTTTLAISILDSTPGRDDLLAILERALARIPRLRQRVVELPSLLATPVWQEDPDFNLDDHLKFLRAPAGSGWEFVLDLAATMTVQGFDRSRPLWEFVVLEGLPEGRTALLQKLHHSVGDGKAGVALLAALYADPGSASGESFESDVAIEPDPGDPSAAALRLAVDALGEDLRDTPGRVLRALWFAADAASRPLESARRAYDEMAAIGDIMVSGPGPYSPLLRGRSSRRTFASLTVPTARLQAAARHAGCRFNDAFLAAVTRGLSLYHERNGAPVESLRASIPISIRSDADQFTVDNRLAIGRFPVPCSEPDPQICMQQLHRRVDEQREPASLAAFEALASLVVRTPTPLLLPLIADEMCKSDFVATVVPGPPMPLQLAGVPVRSLHAFGPTAGAALNATLMTYQDESTVSFTLDPVAVPSVAPLLEAMEEGFQEVLDTVR